MKINKKILFLGGVFGPVLYLLNDIIGGAQTLNYSYIINTVSDLTKAGTQDAYILGSILLFISAVMSIVFGVGIMLSFEYRYSKKIFLGGLFLIVVGLFNTMTGTIFPQDTIGAPLTFFGIMHLVFVATSALLVFPILIMIGSDFYKLKNWKKFRTYTFASVFIMLIFGALSLVVIKNEIQILGLVERVSVYTFQIWSVGLALNLIND